MYSILDHGQAECALKQLDLNSTVRVEDVKKSTEYPSRKSNVVEHASIGTGLRVAQIRHSNGNTSA